MIIIVLKVIFGLLCFIFLQAQDLLLLQSFDSKLIQNNPQNYLWSEKLDGVRAYWDGKALYSRGGKLLNPPAFFTQNFPPFKIDGELWSKRGDFENIISIIKSSKRQEDWKDLKFYIFEVPDQKGGLLERLRVLQAYLSTHPTAFIQIIPQYTFETLQELIAILEDLSAKGAEGIVVREKNVPYYTGRNKNAMKLKKFQDRECKILSYIQGKIQDQIGALMCQDGTKSFKIGSGFSEDFRKNPPKIGTIITYKYYGLTQKGMPRFPVFLRIYHQELEEKNANP